MRVADTAQRSLDQRSAVDVADAVAANVRLSVSNIKLLVHVCLTTGLSDAYKRLIHQRSFGAQRGCTGESIMVEKKREHSKQDSAVPQLVLRTPSDWRAVVKSEKR